jgi:hypothetical protein
VIDERIELIVSEVERFRLLDEKEFMVSETDLLRLLEDIVLGASDTERLWDLGELKSSLVNAFS